ncbi:MAG TPA: SgcJ/EcaC family oxidoreductase [Streptosporangiaceae bacterium]
MTEVTQRPDLAAGGVSAGEARTAVEALVAELQAGIDTRDADVYNRHFAADLLWGSPFGMVLQGYEPLHAIHVRINAEQRGGPASRYEVAAVLSPAPDVIVTQVRRVALAPDGTPVPPAAPGADPGGAFSEMAMYVLVRRDGDWWLAAGQNTIVQPPPFTPEE